MSKDTFLSFNLFLSIFGIFLSFYYFGTRVYHYPVYELNNILTMAITLLSLFNALFYTDSSIRSHERYIIRLKK